MKVGAYFSGFPPVAGGGYVFESEILRALLTLAPECRHEIVLLLDAEYWRPGSTLLETSALQIRLVDRPRSLSALQRFGAKLMHRMGLKGALASLDSPLQKMVIKESIQMVWFVTPIFLPVDAPYIATVWDIQHRVQPWFPEVSCGGEWERREAYYREFLQRAAFIITPNTVGKNELSFFYQIPEERFMLLTHPVPYMDSVPSQKEVTATIQKYGLRNKYLFYPAQFWAHKNHGNLLRALSIIREQYQLDLDLVLCGSNQGNLRYIQALTKSLRLQRNVHFLNFIPREDLLALYAGALALTYVTYFGPENLPPLEAFACGCPVIASNVAGALEQYGNAAILVEPSNPEDIAQAVRNLCENPEMRNDLIAHGRARSSGFSSLDYTSRVLDALEKFAAIRINWQ